MKGIEVNENLIFDLTSDYAKKYDSIPETNKQAIQWAYEKGREQAITEFAETIKEKYSCFGYISEMEEECIDEIAKKLKGR